MLIKTLRKPEINNGKGLSNIVGTSSTKFIYAHQVFDRMHVHHISSAFRSTRRHAQQDVLATLNVSKQNSAWPFGRARHM